MQPIRRCTPIGMRMYECFNYTHNSSDWKMEHSNFCGSLALGFPLSEYGRLRSTANPIPLPKLKPRAAG
jgi:hypothetical protein